MAQSGRNDKCPCGSGKKFKQCCANKAQSSWSGRIMTGLVLVVLLGAVFAGITAITSDQGSSSPMPGQVWSPEHGHYH